MKNLIKIGENRHLHGDSTISLSFEALFENSKKADMLFADPPYCLLTRRRKSGELRDPHKAKINHSAVTKFESVRDYKIFTKKWLELSLTYVKEDSIIIIWTNFLGKKPTIEVAQELGLTHFYGEFTWVKLPKKGGGNEITARIYEVALVFSTKPLKDESVDSLPMCWSIVGQYDEDGEAEKWGSHPNHKPFSVLSPLIRQFSKSGDIILDPFTGSGSTPAASVKLKRIIYGIELREEWAKMSQDRLENSLV